MPWSRWHEIRRCGSEWVRQDARRFFESLISQLTRKCWLAYSRKARSEKPSPKSRLQLRKKEEGTADSPHPIVSIVLLASYMTAAATLGTGSKASSRCSEPSEYSPNSMSCCQDSGRLRREQPMRRPYPRCTHRKPVVPWRSSSPTPATTAHLH